MSTDARRPTLRRYAASVLVFCALVGLRDAPVQAAAPSGRFIVVGDTVTDSLTKLTWQRTPTATLMVLADAKTTCKNRLPLDAWRLPTVVELHSIVDIRVSPTIDTHYFDIPAAVADPHLPFWTSSLDLRDIEFASLYYVRFQSGQTDSGRNESNLVRCVRSTL